MMKQRQKHIKYDTQYKRLGKTKDSSDDSDDEMELFVKNKPPRKEIPTTDKVIEDGDSLQSLAIRYSCTIGDLKRLNNIDKDNEIFAKRTIKVPHRPFTMAIAGIHLSGRSSPESSSQQANSKVINVESLSARLDSNVLTVPSGSMNEVNKIIFNSQITQKQREDIEESAAGCSDEDQQLLPNRDAEIKEVDPIMKTLSCSGADADISWIGLVFIVVLILAVPLIIIFYVAEHIETYKHHGS